MARWVLCIGPIRLWTQRNPAGRDPPVVGCYGRVSRRSISADAVTAHKAMNVSTAFTVWLYSHCVRSSRQFSGTVVQLLVALLVGSVQMKKITSVAVIRTKPASASQNTAPRPRTQSRVPDWPRSRKSGRRRCQPARESCAAAGIYAGDSGKSGVEVTCLRSAGSDMGLKVLRFVVVVLFALALVPVGAHLLARVPPSRDTPPGW
jgi:hypothetical protein